MAESLQTHASVAVAPIAHPGTRPSLGDNAESIFVAQLVLLIVVGRLLGEIMRRIRQPALIGQLLAGLVLGPSILGSLWPAAEHLLFPHLASKSMIDGVAQLGVLLILMMTGMETDLQLVRKVGPAALTVSLAGVILPFIGGFALAEHLPDSIIPAAHRTIAALLIGTALSISSVNIVGVVVREMHFTRRNVGQLIVASAIIQDTIGWVVVALILGLATDGRFSWLGLTETILPILVFLALSFTLGRRIVNFLIRWSNDNFQSEYPVITMILAIMGTMALISQLIGAHTVLGAFVAGVLIGESPILTKHIEGELRGIVTALFMPVFFGLAGLSANLSALRSPTLLLVTGALIVVASFGKFAGAYVGGRIARLSNGEALALGSGMNARGSTEVIIASIGLAMGALTQDIFTMIVAMAVITTMAMPPMLRAALRRLPFNPGEEERLKNEAMDLTGFIAQCERILLAVDASDTGRYCARIAGLIAGAKGMPTTVLHIEGSPQKPSAKALSADAPETALKTGAKTSAASEMNDAEAPNPDKVAITTIASAAGPASAKVVQEESRKGYDLFLVGSKHSVDDQGRFSKEIGDLVQNFDGAVGLLNARDESKLTRLTPRARILVPVNGTEPSRHAAEVAIALARPTGATVIALYVVPTQEGAAFPKERRRSAQQERDAVLEEISGIARRYGVTLKAKAAARGTLHEVILKELKRDIALAVYSGNQRPGDELFFGNTATAILTGWDGPQLLIANRPTRPKVAPEVEEGPGAVTNEAV